MAIVKFFSIAYNILTYVSTPMNRRKFLITGTSALGMTSTSLFTKRDKLSSSIPKMKEVEDKITLIDKTAKVLNPSLTEAVLSTYNQVTESSKLIDTNNKTIKDTESLAYSNADAFMHGCVAPVTYAASLVSRIPVEELIKFVTHGMSEEDVSELTTITSFHAHTFLVLSLRNYLAEEGRDIILKLLTKNPAYKNDPRNIPVPVLMKEILDSKESLSKGFWKNIEKIKGMKGNYIESLKGGRGWLDTGIVGVSIPVAFSNTGMSRLLGAVLRHGVSGRNMISRDVAKGDQKAIDEQAARMTTNLITYPSNLALNALFQEILGRTNLIKGLSKDKQAQSHLRDLISTLFSFGAYQTVKVRMQQSLECAVRKQQKEPVEERSFWIKGLQSYINPNNQQIKK